MDYGWMSALTERLKIANELAAKLGLAFTTQLIPIH